MGAPDASSWVELAVGVVMTVIGWLARHFGVGVPKDKT